jgi:hypothetical protein
MVARERRTSRSSGMRPWRPRWRRRSPVLATIPR